VVTSSRHQPPRDQPPHGERHLRLVQTPADDVLGVQPPSVRPLPREREARAVAALTVLYGDALAAHGVQNETSDRSPRRRAA
jgi:hypothetical protein